MLKKGIFTLLLCFMMGTVVHSAGITVSPTVVEALLYPEGSYEGSYNLINSSQFRIRVNIHAENWLFRVYENNLGYEGEKEIDWIEFAETEVILEPNAETQVGFSLKAPKEFEEEKVAQVFFAFSAVDVPSNLNTRMGTIVYLTPAGIEIGGEIANFKVEYKVNEDKETGEKSGVLESYFEVVNTGKAHLRPFGDVNIYKAETDEAVGSVFYKPKKGVYPKLKELFPKTEAFDILEPGNYYATVKLDIGALHRQDLKIEEKVEFKVA